MDKDGITSDACPTPSINCNEGERCHSLESLLKEREELKIALAVTRKALKILAKKSFHCFAASSTNGECLDPDMDCTNCHMTLSLVRAELEHQRERAEMARGIGEG